jgi:hydroxymethylpyrimidine/phosphomethylpyrimidine kinase
MKPPRHYARVLTIAGSDSGGGAGIQADLKTFAALGCYGASVITALTAQNTLGVTAIHPVPVDFVTSQIDAVLSDIGADAVKIGMLFSPELIRAVARGLQRHHVRQVVLDPVMVAQSGDKLLQDEAIDALKTELLPLATLITPNLPEASVLLGHTIDSPDAARQAAQSLASLGCPNVLVKGGHLESGPSDDCLFLGRDKRLLVLSGRRVETRNNHGTGCTLSSAIAAGLARGLDLETAVQQAKEYIEGAIEAGRDYVLGQGCGPVHHFYRFFP